MMPTGWDHLLALFLLVVVPLHATVTYRQLLARLATGEVGVRIREYRWVIGLQWGLVALVLVLWVFAGRGAALLGLTVPGGWPGIGGLAITAVGLAFLAAQGRAIAALEVDRLEGLKAQLAGARALLPTTDEESATFRWVAITAGICEELIYRGYLIWYLGGYLGGWLGAVLAALLFGLGHFYQGPSGAVKAGVVGLAAGLLFVGTGSLLWPMVLHAAVDLQGGAVGRRVFGESPRPR